MKISYAITVYNELSEIKRLIPILSKLKREEDEIVVLFDDKGTDEVWQYLVETEESIDLLHRAKFNNDFSEWKNLLTKLCSGDYIFNIDADECPNEYLISNIHNVLEQNPTVEMFIVPRINTVEGITQEHINKWGWQINDKGWVNFPDYQSRVYRRNGEIIWANKVHERVINTKSYAYLPDEEYWCLYHPKTIERQEKQNNYYNTL